MTTTFLTSFYLDEVPTDRTLNWEDSAAVHRFVMSRFGDLGSKESPRLAGSILFRLERVGKRQRLLIQSAVKPQGEQRTVDISSVLAGLNDGVSCRFRLDVNPVQRVSKTGADRVVAQDEMPAWLATKLSPAFSLDELLDASVEVRKAKKNKIAVLSVDGVVTVKDAVAARAMLRDGVGRRKSHGCGLLTLLPQR